MGPRRLARGLMLVSVTVLAWGATFPVAKSALASIDGFWAPASTASG